MNRKEAFELFKKTCQKQIDGINISNGYSICFNEETTEHDIIKNVLKDDGMEVLQECVYPNSFIPFNQDKTPYVILKINGQEFIYDDNEIFVLFLSNKNYDNLVKEFNNNANKIALLAIILTIYFYYLSSINNFVKDIVLNF